MTGTVVVVKRLKEFWIKHWWTSKPEAHKAPINDSMHVREVKQVTDAEIEKAVPKQMGLNMQMAWKAGARVMRKLLGGGK